MITNGFSKQLYTKVVMTLLLLFPAVLLALLLIITAIVSAVHFNSEDFDVLAFAGVLINFYLYALAASWFFGLLVAIFGRRSYKTYAIQVINYDDDVDIKARAVTDQKIKITYKDEHGIHRKTIRYSDYGIRVKYRDNFSVPTFFVEDGTINRVVLPYVEGNEDIVYNTYKIK